MMISFYDQSHYKHSYTHFLKRSTLTLIAPTPKEGNLAQGGKCVGWDKAEGGREDSWADQPGGERGLDWLQTPVHAQATFPQPSQICNSHHIS